jgi:YHS domain-containing protein
VALLVRILLFLLLALMALRAVMRFVAGLMIGVSDGRAQPPRQVGGHMVKDPVCGTYVVEGRALTAVRGGRTEWFCSPECQHAWLEGKVS